MYAPPPTPALEEDDAASWERVSPSELRERQLWVERHAEELATHGIYVSGHTACGALLYFALDEAGADAELRRRCEKPTTLQYLGASREVLRPHPFGSWLDEGTTLHLFYGLPHNGEHAGGCVIAERDDCVIAALSIVDWLGAKTLAGGYRPSHATVPLSAPLGSRQVIDNFDNRVRPHWRSAAQTA